MVYLRHNERQLLHVGLIPQVGRGTVKEPEKKTLKYGGASLVRISYIKLGIWIST